jgi:hypothetical protein
MHVTPVEAPQQSALAEHLSPFAAHPPDVDRHEAAPPSESIAQYPPQQSVPDAQLCPSLLHGGSE